MYLNAPKDTNMTMFTYLGTRSNTEADLSLVNPGTNATINVGSFAYARIINIFGRTGGPGFSIPYISIESTATDTGKTLQALHGWGDPSLTFDINVFGADAMSAGQFSLTPPRTYCSLHLAVGTPWGSYRPDRPINLGGNRWTGKATLNYSITRDEGDSWLDFYVTARIFADNDDYFGGRTQSQEAVYSIETHYSHNVTPRIWLGGGMAYTRGGQVTIDGLETGNAQNTIRGIASAGFPLWKGTTGIISYNQTLFRPVGSPKEGTLMLSFIALF